MESPLQGEAWARCQLRMGKPVARLSGDGWRALAIHERRRIGSYVYVPYGPVCDDAAALPEALRQIAVAARAVGAWWVRVEPMAGGHDIDAARPGREWEQTLRAEGFRRAAKDHQPRCTRLIDLTRSEADLLAQMTGSNRTIYRNHAKKGLEVRRSQDPADVGILTGFLAQAAAAKGIVSRSGEYLHEVAAALMPLDAATLYTTWRDDEPLCATLVYDSEHQRLFAHSAMPVWHRRARPNQPLLVTALLDAARRGQRTADLFGIAPPDEPDHPWAGFSAFKRSFGGQDVCHLGTWERELVPGVLRATRAAGDWRARRRASAAAGATTPAADRTPVAHPAPTADPATAPAG